MLDSDFPSYTVLWCFSRSRDEGLTAHSRLNVTGCWTSIVATTPRAVVMVHKCLAMMDDEVTAIMLIVAGSEH